MLVFALNAAESFGQGVAAALGQALAPHEERGFEDGEHKARPLLNVRGRDVFVIQNLSGEPGDSVNDRFCRLLFFAATLKQASAARVTAVLPYLCYARKDRQTKPRDPVTTRFVAQHLEAAGIDRVLCMDVHNLAAFQNAFRCQSEHLEARPLFIEHLLPRLGEASPVVVSPDAGGAKRAERFRTGLAARLGRALGSAYVEKFRSGGVVSGERLIGEVAGRPALIVDDMISTGGTMLRAARACREAGATSAAVLATHGLFNAGAEAVLADPAIAETVVSNSVPQAARAAEAAGGKLVVLDARPLFAAAIRRIHDGGSIVELLEIEAEA